MINYISHGIYEDTPLFSNKSQPEESVLRLPIGTKLVERNNILFYKNSQAICWVDSPNGHKYFAINNDGNGLIRGLLTQSIIKEISDTPWKIRLLNQHEKELQKYKRNTLISFWDWNNDFYKAPIKDLEKISKILNIKGVKEILKLYYDIKR